MNEAPDHDPSDLLGAADWLERLRAVEAAAPLGRLGRFEVLAEIARGGQAVVYRALDPATRNVVAVKCFTQFDRGGQSAHLRLQREIRATHSLSHPGIVRILGVESAGPYPLLVLEWIDGEPLDAWAARTAATRTPRTSVEIVACISEILVHAHQRGVIHRDLKPSNILVDRDGHPHVIDFGLAKLHDELPRGRASAIFAGTLAYAAPELLENGLTAVDARSDIYALGVMLYQLLAGRLPYELGDSISSAVEAIRNERPAAIGRGAADAALGVVLARALAKRPEDRYQSADALHADLRRFLAGEPIGGASPNAPSFRSLARRHPLAFAATTLALVALVGFAATMATLYRRAHDEAARAQRAEQFLATTLREETAPASPAAAQRDALLRASAAAGLQWADEPAIESRVRTALARRFADLALWPQATQESRRALELIPEGRARERVEPLWHLGIALTLTGKDNGEPLLHEALGIERAADAPDPNLMAGILESLAFVHGLWQPVPDRDRAEREFQESFAWRERAGVPSLGGVQALYSYAEMHARAGDHATAVASLESARTLLERLGDVPRHQRTLVYEAHALALRRQGRLHDAEAAYRDAIAAREGTLDARLPPCWAFLGDVVHATGRPAEALRHYETAAVTRCEFMAERHPLDQDRFLRMAASIRAHGLRAADVRTLATLLQERAPELIPALAYTTRRIARVHADLGHDAESAAIAAALPDPDALLPASQN